MNTTTDDHAPSDEPGSQPGPSGPRISAAEARDLARMVRTAKNSPERRHVAGVAGGVARHLDVDPAIIRVAFVVLVFFGGAGLLLYGAGWLLLPDETDGRAVVNLDPRSRVVTLYVAAGLGVLALLGDTLGGFEFPWPLAFVALILLAIFGTRDRVRAPDWQPPTTAARATAPSATAPASATAQPTFDPSVPPAASAVPPTVESTVPPTAPPAWTTPPTWAPPPPDPRRRGPILFWFTLALIVLLEGVLGVLAAAGVEVPGPAYPALAAGVTGAMLVLGAFWGRAGGLILIGLLSTAVLIGSVAAQELDGHGDHVHATPLVAADLAGGYRMDAGELSVDLTRIGDLTALDGRQLELDGGVGSIEVTVPDDLNVIFDGEVHGPGQIEFLGDGRGGISTTMDRTRVVADDAPTLTIDAELGVGQIAVRSE